MPAQFDFEAWRGTTKSIVMRLKTNAVPMTWGDVAVSYQPQGGAVITRKLSDADPAFTVTDVPTSEITWTLSVAATRALPVGSKTKYELQVTNPNGGTGEKVYVFGTITAKGGLNPDA